MSSIDQQFIEYIVKSLVSNPDAVKIERRIDEKGVLLELTVDPEDLGRIIGKRGATAQSLRTLLRALGTKNDARYNLKIVDNGTPAPKRAMSVEEDTASQPTASDNGDDAVVSDDLEDDMNEKLKDEKETSSVVTKTRKELEELDDLDV
jgi:uncharacterized protein